MQGSTLMRIGWRGCLLFLLVGLAVASPGQTTTTATMAAPAVQDEPNQPEPQQISAPYAAGGAAATGAKSGMFTGVPQAREEIRRAFIKQDYERVLTLNREMVRQFGVDDSNSFYLTAAQLRLADKQELKAGKRHFMRLGDRTPAPQIGNAPPPVEASLNAPATDATATDAATSAPGAAGTEMPAVEATPEVTPTATPTPMETPMVVATAPTPAIENATKDDGTLLTPMGEPAGGAANETIETANGEAAPAEATPVPTPEVAPQAEATPQAGTDEFQIATAMTPMPTPETTVAPVTTVRAPGSDLLRNITFALLACALLALGAIVVIAKRRREVEPEEDLVTTLSGLRVDAQTQPEAPIAAPPIVETAPMARTSERPAAAEAAAPPMPAPDATELDSSLLGEDEFVPMPPPEAERELTQTERIDAFTESMFGQPGEPETLEQLAASREIAESRPDTSNEDSLLQIAGLSEETMTHARPGEEPPTQFLGEKLGAPINLDALPDMPEEQKYQPATDTISLDAVMDDEAPKAQQAMAEAETQRDPFVEDLAPYRKGEPAPELEETRDETSRGRKPQEPQHSQAAQPEAAPHEITRTSWNQSAESTGNIRGEDSDLPSLGTAEDNLMSFHPDETIDVLKPGEMDLEATIASEPGEMDAAEATIASPPMPEVSLGDKPAEEDLFDREYRIGLECFNRQEWGPAVHHLSVAAALRPDQQQVKDKLREARRLRKI